MATKLPIEMVVEMRALFDPIMRQQLRGVIAAQALGGLLSEAAVYKRWADCPAVAVELADRTMELLYPDDLAESK